MIVLTLAEVAEAVGGRLAGGARGELGVTAGVVADSRQVAPGGLFVALAGTRTDGHTYASAALAAGAVAVLADREVGGPAVLVDDPLAALGRLARAVVDRIEGLTVVGVTGSSGKTSTKDLLARLLADVGPTVAPSGSFNNELGLPLTALRCDRRTRFLVAEMGAREPGNIRYLCGITPPRIAVELNVGAAHLGVFGSIEVTAATKAELVAALPPGGLAVLNADDPRVRAMAASAAPARVVFFGRGEAAAVRADDVRLDELARARFELVTPQGSAPVRLQLHGEHHVGNALAAAAVALEAGLPVHRVAQLLSGAAPDSRWRMEVATRPDAVVVVNDAYNANPDSMRAAVRALVAMGRTAPAAGRTWAVLGEMLELGPGTDAEHEALGAGAIDLGVDRVLAVGHGAGERIRAGAAAACLRRGGAVDDVLWAADGQQALRLLAPRLRPGDVVLVKASRAVGLERLADALLRPPPACAAPDPPADPVPAIAGARIGSAGTGPAGSGSASSGSAGTGEDTA